MIEGVASDLEPRALQTFDELYRYCYHVASVVGLSTIHIFGFDSPDAVPLAEKCGIAFQLTNILRDVREDAERERVYLPAEDLRRFGVNPGELRNGRPGDAVRSLLEFEAERARDYYRESAAAGRHDPQAQPGVAARADRHLFAPARAHCGKEVRRVYGRRSALDRGEVLDRPSCMDGRLVSCF